jgi:hypothetical protein
VKTKNLPDLGSVHLYRKEIGMDAKPTITLDCVRKDGGRERTKIFDHTMSEARELAEWVLYAGEGLYTEVDICAEDGTVETIRNPAVVVPVGTA